MSKRTSEEQLERAFRAKGPGPKRVGRVVLLVVRASAADMPKGQDKISEPLHTRPKTIRFSVEEGVEGDRWRSGKDINAQISMTSMAVTLLVAGRKDRWHLSGDNLVVDLDMSAEALPAGTRLQLGSGMIEISPLPHEPCDRYLARLGQAANRWVENDKHSSRHLRGRYARVIEGGKVSIGDEIIVVPG